MNREIRRRIIIEWNTLIGNHLMKKVNWNSMQMKKIFFCWSLLLVFTCCKKSSRIEKVVELKDYSSGSGIAYYREKVYLIGDDMNYILIADTALNKLDTITLQPGSGRIPKRIKQDVEGLSVLRTKGSSSLLLVGSGSVFPYRSKGWIIDLHNWQKRMIDLEPFYKRMQVSGVKEINIEGLASIPGGIVLANRGNKTNPKNYLVFTSSDFWTNPERPDIRVMKLGANTDTLSFSGVSGLEYSYKSDCLILTVSTENTYSSQADGSIGKSYLWIIENITAKKRLAAINPNRIIDLETIDQRFYGHKIESVCIISETNSTYNLVLVADDDKGTSMLFKLELQKKD